MPTDEHFVHTRKVLQQVRELAEVGCPEYSIKSQLGLSDESMAFYRQLIIEKTIEESKPSIG